MTARTSFTPALSADSGTNRRLVACETTCAMVVLPVPGGPQRISDIGASPSTSRRSGVPGPSRCRWPTTSSRVPGRIRTASGAVAATACSAAASNRVTRRRYIRPPPSTATVGPVGDAWGVFARIGRFCARRGWLVLAGWLLVVVAGAGASGPVFARLESGQASGRFESIQAYDILADHGRYGGRVLGLVDEVRVSEPAVRAAVLAAAHDIGELPHV